MTDLINGRTPEGIKRILRLESFDCGGIDCSDCEYIDICKHVDIEDCAIDALAYIEHLEAQIPRWISVEERLPERYTPVLGGIKKDGTKTYIAIVVIFDEGCWAKDTGFYYDDVGGRVTHWMPLPEASEVNT